LRARHLIHEKKTTVASTDWSYGGTPPRHVPVFQRTFPIGKGWQWRFVSAKNDKNAYVLHVRCNSEKDERKAWLMIKLEKGWSIVGRFEYHSSHPGLHVHSNCVSSGLLVGEKSISECDRFPDGGRYHRRIQAWTPDVFWNRALKFFRIVDERGTLL
jgi:hypothetical protein